jgi:hypothetical protein
VLVLVNTGGDVGRQSDLGDSSRLCKVVGARREDAARFFKILCDACTGLSLFLIFLQGETTKMSTVDTAAVVGRPRTHGRGFNRNFD